VVTRRELLKLLGVGLLLPAGPPLLLQSCAGLAAYHGNVQNNRMDIPRTQARALLAPNGILVVTAPNLAGSIVLRHVEKDGIVALSSVCTHRGCELRPFPDSLRCPCHGSEFDELGDVIQGPARFSLRRYRVEETVTSYIIHFA